MQKRSNVFGMNDQYKVININNIKRELDSDGSLCDITCNFPTIVGCNGKCKWCYLRNKLNVMTNKDAAEIVRKWNIVIRLASVMYRMVRVYINTSNGIPKSEMSFIDDISRAVRIANREGKENGMVAITASVKPTNIPAITSIYGLRNLSDMRITVAKPDDINNVKKAMESIKGSISARPRGTLHPNVKISFTTITENGERWPKENIARIGSLVSDIREMGLGGEFGYEYIIQPGMKSMSDSGWKDLSKIKEIGHDTKPRCATCEYYIKGLANNEVADCPISYSTLDRIELSGRTYMINGCPYLSNMNKRGQ